MQISKISSANHNTNFQAVNMKYFKKAKDACSIGGNLYEQLFCLDVDVSFKSISPQDALDTLKALLPYARKQHLWLIKEYKERFEYFKELYSKEEQ